MWSVIAARDMTFMKMSLSLVYNYPWTFSTIFIHNFAYRQYLLNAYKILIVTLVTRHKAKQIIP